MASTSRPAGSRLRRLALLAAIAGLALPLAACGGSAETTDKPTKTTEKSEPAMSQTEMIAKAEEAAKNELPDIPLWKGTKFKGTVVDETSVCVDRTYRKGGGIDGKGGNAGYVVVSFPDVKTGEPQDGMCADYAPAVPLPPVEVPDDVADEPGLVTRDQFGDKWPLNVDYGVVRCENQSAIFTAPDGTDYALNGTAKTHTDAKEIRPIWTDDPDVDGLKIDIGPLIDKALTFC